MKKGNETSNKCRKKAILLNSGCLGQRDILSSLLKARRLVGDHHLFDGIISEAKSRKQSLPISFALF